jgi:glycosyltransferase involved in cell wall biosynthesis
VTIATLGQQRGTDKGYHLMPEIARLLLRSGREIRLLVHNSLPEMMPGPHQELRRLAAASEGRITIYERIADATAWPQLLAASDLILCPYEPRAYRFAFSGVAVEAVANGIPFVGPADTSLERLVVDFGGCGVTFEAWEPGAIAAATTAAIDGLDELAERAFAAAHRWPQIQGPERLVDALLAFGG